MRHSRFEPAIHRNRLVTNWVAASRQGTDHSKRTAIKLGLFGALISLSALLVAIALPNEQPEKTAERSSAPVKQPVAECTTESVRAWLSGGSQSLSGVTLVPITSPEDFGGLRSESYLCTSDEGLEVFNTIWVSEDHNWELKKISRPSDDEPGDP